MTLYEKRLAEDVEVIRDKVREIADRVCAALGAAAEAIAANDRESLNRVVMNDYGINRDIRCIDRRCHEFVARHLPAAAGPPQSTGRGRERVPPFHGDLPRQPGHGAYPARQRPARGVLVHDQQQDLRSRLHRGARRRPGTAAPRHLREEILRAADIFLENGTHIETGPHKHAIQGTFFLYVWEPAGNRVELANPGARLILAPDWEPVIWTEADRKKGQAWGLKTIETFHTHGTPPVEK